MKNSFQDKSSERKIKLIEDRIERKDRSPLVRDYEFGKIISEKRTHMDIPSKSQFEYEDEFLIFEDFNDLDEFLKEVFIPNNVAYKSKLNKETGQKERYLSIQLNKILALRLSEEEVKHTIDYLQHQGIHVGGYASTLAGEFENYDYIRTYKESPLPEVVVEQEQMKLFTEYQMIEDKSSDYARETRNKIAIGNMRLVPFVAYKYAIATGIDIHELESYGYEGLLIAIERFDVSLGYNFSTYAIHYIKGYIQNGLPEFYKMKKGLFYYDFIKCKIAIERALSEEFDKKISLDEYPEIIDEILKFMVYQGMISEKSIDMHKRMLNIAYCGDIENYCDTEGNFNVEEFIINNIMMKKDINEALSDLNCKEETVLRLRFGLNSSGVPEDLETVGKKFGKSRERVRQIEKKALRKLRHPDISKGLHIYLEN